MYMETVKVNCKNCNIELEKSKYEYDAKIKAGNFNFFCSLSCGAKYQMKCKSEKIKLEYDINPTKCKICNTIIPYIKRHKNREYCSRKCSYEGNKEALHKNATIHGKFKIKPCKICGVDTKNIYCSKSCESENARMKRIDKVVSGKYSSYPASGRPTLRKALFDIKGKKCESCENVLWKLKDKDGVVVEKEIPLTVHHLDGNACNNKLENLQLLCWNCHSLTDNYGRKNKGSSRSYRKKHYDKHCKKDLSICDPND